MNDPSPSFRGIPGSVSARTSPAHQPAQSMRSRRIGGTWARPRNSDDGYSRLVFGWPSFNLCVH
jgi:syntaxin-binding protein 1